MPIKLKNTGRLPVSVYELASLGEDEVSVVRMTEAGREETTRTYPRSLLIPGRDESDVLPDSVRTDPALAPHLRPQGPLVIVEVAAAPKPSEPTAPAPEESAPSGAPNNPDGVKPQEQ